MSIVNVLDMPAHLFTGGCHEGQKARVRMDTHSPLSFLVPALMAWFDEASDGDSVTFTFRSVTSQEVKDRKGFQLLPQVYCQGR